MVEISVPLFEMLLVSYIIGVVVSAAAVYHTHKNVWQRGGQYLTLMSVAGFLWSLNSIFKLLTNNSIIATHLLSSTETAVVLAASASFLGFAYRFSGAKRRISMKNYLLVCSSIIGFSLLLSFTNPYHSLMWDEFARVGVGTSAEHVVAENTVVHSLLMITAYAASLAGILLLTWKLTTGYRRPIVGAIFGVGLSGFIIANLFAYVLPSSVYSYPTTVSAVGIPLFLSSTLVGLNYHKKSLSTDLKSDISTDSGLFVIDSNYTIVDYDDEFRIHFGEDNSKKRIEGEKLPEVSELLYDTLEQTFIRNELNRRYRLDVGGEESYYEFDSTRISRGGAVFGFAITFKKLSTTTQQVSKTERTHRQIREFSELIPHELRNPLSIAFGNVETARETINPNMSPTDVARAESALNTALNHLDSLDSRVDDAVIASESIEKNLNYDWVEVEKIINSALIQSDINSEEVITQSRSHQVLADREYITKGMVNLLTEVDGLKTEDSDLRVSVGGIDGNSGTGYVEFRFATKPEIRNKLSKLFDKRYTVPTRDSGLGFSLVTIVAEGHGWELSYQDSNSGNEVVVGFKNVEIRRHKNIISNQDRQKLRS